MRSNTGRENCTNCAASILPATFERNEGLCEPCRIRQGRDLREQLSQRDDMADRSAKRGMWQDDSEFVGMLRESLALAQGDPQQASRNFLGLCEAVRFTKEDELQRSLGSLLRKLGVDFNPQDLMELASPNAFHARIQDIPRPFRELFAVYYAWGAIGSDGIEAYLETTSRNFDDEVDRGLQALGFTAAQGVMRKIRKSSPGRGQGMSQVADKMSFMEFFDLLGHDFESAVLGPFLKEFCAGLSGSQNQ